MVVLLLVWEKAPNIVLICCTTLDLIMEVIILVLTSIKEDWQKKWFLIRDMTNIKGKIIYILFKLIIIISFKIIFTSGNSCKYQNSSQLCHDKQPFDIITIVLKSLHNNEYSMSLTKAFFLLILSMWGSWHSSSEHIFLFFKVI